MVWDNDWKSFLFWWGGGHRNLHKPRIDLNDVSTFLARNASRLTKSTDEQGNSGFSWIAWLATAKTGIRWDGVVGTAGHFTRSVVRP
jgi:hypothetical protein